MNNQLGTQGEVILNGVIVLTVYVNRTRAPIKNRTYLCNKLYILWSKLGPK